MLWVHDKTGNLYDVLNFNVVNATNLTPTHLEVMVLYRDNRNGQVFVREKKEFVEKFTCTEGLV